MYEAIKRLKMEATNEFHSYKSLLLKTHVILFLLKNNYQQLGGIFYAHTKQEK